MVEMSMRERLARVIDPEAFRVRGDIAARSDLGKRIAGMRRHALSQADAVLEALREPDEGMVEAGRNAPGCGLCPVRTLWRAMIDHALVE
jgi:hypothetical protein